MKNATTDAAQASMRLKDLQLTAELLAEAARQEHGARERIADKHQIHKSVIADRVKRIELFFGVQLFTGPQRKTPTAAGLKMARYAPLLMTEIEHLTAILREANERNE